MPPDAEPSPGAPPQPTLRIDVLTLFPGLFDGFLGESILSRAIAWKLVEVRRWDIRDWAEGKHRQVDDRPFGGGAGVGLVGPPGGAGGGGGAALGGGPGMVLRAPPVVAAVEAVQALGARSGRLVALTPQGRRLDQGLVRELAREERIVLLCGRYEGFDERIFGVL